MVYDIIESGKVAEWLKALVLKTREGNLRRFESCPFRQIGKSKACFGFSNLKERRKMTILSFPPFFVFGYFLW